MQTIWVVVADEGRARFLELREPGQDLRDVEELTDAAAHADRADLRRDAQGRFHGPGGQQGPGSGTAPPRTDELDKEADLFARRVAERLVDAHRKHRYEQLRIVAAPRFLGRLRQQQRAHRQPGGAAAMRAGQTEPRQRQHGAQLTARP